MMQVADSSRASLDALGLKERKSISDQIVSVVAQAMRSGRKDLSMREVKAELRRVYGSDPDMSTISGRVNELVAAERLVRDKQNRRPCMVTGHLIEPVSVPAEQGRLCY